MRTAKVCHRWARERSTWAGLRIREEKVRNARQWESTKLSKITQKQALAMEDGNIFSAWDSWERGWNVWRRRFKDCVIAAKWLGFGRRHAERASHSLSVFVSVLQEEVVVDWSTWMDVHLGVPWPNLNWRTRGRRLGSVILSCRSLRSSCASLMFLSAVLWSSAARLGDSWQQDAMQRDTKWSSTGKLKQAARKLVCICLRRRRSYKNQTTWGL